MPWDFPLPNDGGQRYRISSDSRQYILQHYQGYDSKDERDVWKNLAYYPTPHQCVEEYLQRGVRTANIQTVVHLKEQLKRLVAGLERCHPATFVINLEMKDVSQR